MPPLFYKRGIKDKKPRPVIARSVSQYPVIARSVSDEAIPLSQKGELSKRKKGSDFKSDPFFRPFFKQADYRPLFLNGSCVPIKQYPADRELNKSRRYYR